MPTYHPKDIVNLPLRIQIGVVAAFCLLIVYLGYHWDSASMQRELDLVRTHEKDVKTQLNLLLETLHGVNSDIAQLPSLQQNLVQLQDSLVKTETLADNLNEILKMGLDNQLQFQVFSPGAEVSDAAQPNYRRIPISTIITGEYNQIATFLSQLANMPTLVVIANFELLRGMNKLFDKKEAQEPGYANRITAALNFDLYRYAPPATETTNHGK